ncbi:MAG TPA: hypothetical protein VF121_12815 [Thermoanaerobaculia bacterium]|nr:hypothetical protein [Thermoanaerobaculia bacterium]
MSLALAAPSAPPAPPAAPAVAVSLSGLGTWRPSGAGERLPGDDEVRWVGDLSREVRVVLDVKDDGQTRVTLQRAWSDLPTTAPVWTGKLTVKLADAVAHSAPFRLHHHTRPSLVLRRSPAPRFDLAALTAAGLVPRYARVKIPEDTLSRIAKGRYPWETWSTVPSGKPPRHPPGSYDAISEEHGAIVHSWTGGAGPLLNEAALLMPGQVAYLLSGDPRAWRALAQTADSSGNYAIHYWSRATAQPLRPAETRGLFSEIADADRRYLQDPQVTLATAGGAKLPIPEPAHEHSLVYLAALLTGERYYREELAAWNTYNLLTRPPGGDLRYRGILWSGQVRTSAWSLRTLHELIRVSSGEEKARYEAQLRDNLRWMTENLATPGGPGYRPTGVLNVSEHRPTEMLRQAGGRHGFVSTFMHHFLAAVLGELVRGGYPEAKPMLLHTLKLYEGLWRHGQSRFDLAWGQHAEGADVKTMIARTFEKRATPPKAFVAPVDRGYAACLRGPLVAGTNAGLPWAREALTWLDGAYEAQWGAPPLDWALVPEPAR